MVCAYCGGETEVYNSRLQRKNNQVWRRRRCKQCKATFTTHESLFLPLAFSVDRGSSREAFIPERLFAEVLLALADRKDCYEAARELTATITHKLLKTAQKPSFTPSEVSQITAETLKSFDRRAWLRYIAEHPSLQEVKVGRRGPARS